MPGKTLVAYASNYGSTQEITVVVADELRKAGFNVEIQPLKTIKELSGFDSVVIGAPLYMFHWHADAHHFLSRYRYLLENGLPVAVFAGGPMTPDQPGDLESVKSQMEKELANIPGSNRCRFRSWAGGSIRKTALSL